MLHAVMYVSNTHHSFRRLIYSKVLHVFGAALRFRHILLFGLSVVFRFNVVVEVVCCCESCVF